MRKLVLLVGVFCVLSNVSAADLFEDGKLRPINQGDRISASDTLGGYAIYQGEGLWKLDVGKISSSSGGGITIPMGSVQMHQDESGTMIARQWILANLGQNDTRAWSGSPCAPNHLVIRNKGRGREDGCMTIDPISVMVGDKPTLMFSILMTNSGSNGRYYTVNLVLNASFLGWRDTVVSGWAQEALNVSPDKQAFIDRLTTWAEKLQDSSIKAFDFSKPQDAYKSLVSWRTLLPVPEDLANKKYSMGFLSAVEDLKHKKDFVALAYSPQADFRTRWGNAWGAPSQGDADRIALANCENGRSPNSPPCKFYKMPANQKMVSSPEMNTSASQGTDTPTTAAPKI